MLSASLSCQKQLVLTQLPVKSAIRLNFHDLIIYYLFFQVINQSIKCERELFCLTHKYSICNDTKQRKASNPHIGEAAAGYM